MHIHVATGVSRLSVTVLWLQGILCAGVQRHCAKMREGNVLQLGRVSTHCTM